MRNVIIITEKKEQMMNLLDLLTIYVQDYIKLYLDN